MNSTLKIALCEILINSSPKTKEGVLKMLCEEADPVIEEYLREGQAQQQSLLEWLHKPMLDSAKQAGVSTKLLTQLDNISLSYAQTMGELILKTRDDLLRFRGMGPKLVNELINWIRQSSPEVSDEIVGVVINLVYSGKKGWSTRSILCEYNIFKKN
jgi:hypothetical protein